MKKMNEKKNMKLLRLFYYVPNSILGNSNTVNFQLHKFVHCYRYFLPPKHIAVINLHVAKLTMRQEYNNVFEMVFILRTYYYFLIHHKVNNKLIAEKAYAKSSEIR